MTLSFTLDEARPAHFEALAALFDAAGSSCFCRYWHFTGVTNAWLERSALSPDESRRELEKALSEGSDEARGIVAEGFLDGQPKVLGWLKVAPASVMKKLYDQRLYRRLPCFEGDRSGVFTVSCALIHPAARRKGLATALVAEAVRRAPSWGARALEAFPRRPKEAVRDEELWTGPMGAYARSGFVEVNDFEPYPVLRRDL